MEMSSKYDLISPVFNFSNYDNIDLSFEHYFRYGTPSTATFSYSINNGSNWTTLQQWTSGTVIATTFSQNITTEISGELEVLFKWNYTADDAWYWAIDDLSITGDLIVPIDTITDVTYIKEIADGLSEKLKLGDELIDKILYTNLKTFTLKMLKDS